MHSSQAINVYLCAFSVRGPINLSSILVRFIHIAYMKAIKKHYFPSMNEVHEDNF